MNSSTSLLVPDYFAELRRHGIELSREPDFMLNLRLPSAPRRKAYIPDALRWEVFERDDFRCQHCGSRRRLTVDHIRAEIRGGTLDLENLQTLCRTCNGRKGAR